MRIVIAAVGRFGRGPEKALLYDYAGRLPWTVTLRELEAAKSGNAGERKKREAALLLRLVPERAALVALDGTGDALSSEAFAERMRRWRDGGKRDIAFLIGGPDGHGEEIAKAADLVLSLGAMTWPHMLARVMLAEALFRAHAIMSGHPYHRR
jgi:23S rRNA (pseudouridine1915-N3)-methyltransferase